MTDSVVLNGLTASILSALSGADIPEMTAQSDTIQSVLKGSPYIRNDMGVIGKLFLQDLRAQHAGAEHGHSNGMTALRVFGAFIEGMDIPTDRKRVLMMDFETQAAKLGVLAGEDRGLPRLP